MFEYFHIASPGVSAVGFFYTDGQFDDARLAIVLARTLADLGRHCTQLLPGHAALTRAGRPDLLGSDHP